jgi:hypothetical protein
MGLTLAASSREISAAFAAAVERSTAGRLFGGSPLPSAAPGTGTSLLSSKRDFRLVPVRFVELILVASLDGEHANRTMGETFFPISRWGKSIRFYKALSLNIEDGEWRHVRRWSDRSTIGPIDAS